MFAPKSARTNVLLVDDGDEMQGSLLSNLWHGEARSSTRSSELAGNVATFGNHEFDWGQDVLIARTQRGQRTRT